jgi:hypothetical protein
MDFVKKIVALLIIAGFVMGTVGCGSPTSGLPPTNTTKPPDDKPKP